MLTGGPGAGKTAVLELIQHTLCTHVRVLPEAAGIIFGGGFPREPDPCGRSRHAALRLMATGGVYLAGGMARRALPFLKADAFLNAYRRKGRLTELLQRRIPLHVITKADAALLGAIHYAQIGERE